MTYLEASNPSTDRLLEIASELVAADTQNPPGDTSQLADWIETFFQTHSIETRRITTDPAKPNLVATIPRASDRKLLYNGHLDTGPFDAGEWSYDPLGERVDDVRWSVGSYEAVDSPPVEAVTETAREVAKDRLYRRSATGGGDTKTFRHAGVPTVEFAFGTDMIHAVDEYTTVEALERNAAVYERLPTTFAEHSQ